MDDIRFSGFTELILMRFFAYLIGLLDEISAEFGEEVALLVDGVTKLGQLTIPRTSWRPRQRT